VAARAVCFENSWAGPRTGPPRSPPSPPKGARAMVRLFFMLGSGPRFILKTTMKLCRRGQP
jgi:hypothetical protein